MDMFFRVMRLMGKGSVEIGKFLLKEQLKKETGARFGKRSELKSVLGTAQRGLCVDGAKLRLSEKASMMHLAYVGRSGGGKTSSFIIPNILKLAEERCSIVVSDPSGEIYQQTSGYLHRQGFRVLALDPLDLERSARWNPLDCIKSMTDLEEIPKVLIRSQTPVISPKDEHWYGGAEDIIGLLIACLNNIEPKYRNLANVWHLLLNFGDCGNGLKHFVSYAAPPAIFARWKSLMSENSRVIQSFYGIAKQCLKPLANPSVARLMSRSTFAFEDFRCQKTILYLITPSQKQKYYSFLLNLFYTQFFNSMMEQLPSDRDLPVYVLYDEFGHSAIPDFELIATTIRKFGVSISIILQGLSQLETQYGATRAETILNGAMGSMIFLGGGDLETTKRVEAMIGRVRQQRINEQGDRAIREYHLLMGEEVRTMPKNKAILFHDNYHALIVDLLPYYQQRSMASLVQIPPFVPVGNGHDDLHVIDLGGN